MKLILQAIKAMLRKIEASIDSAQTTANSAKSLADNAQATADNAYTIANDAQTAANSAQTTANSAQTTADSKMSATNPVGSGTFSMGRKSGSKVGRDSHAEGFVTTASGIYSHSEGYTTTADGAYSHAEGSYTTASGESSHAEGRSAKASGAYSHAEGYGTTASGSYSHAEGYNTDSFGIYSHAEGYYTTASRRSQHVYGEYNINEAGASSVQGKYVQIVGNGTPDKRSNAHTLDWSGNAWFAGDVYVGSTSGTDKDAGSKKLATEEYVNNKVSDFGGIQPPTNAEVGQIIVVKAVDENGKPTEWGVEYKPDKLPNPNALTFTGAVTGSYDGSAQLSVEIPQGGGGALSGLAIADNYDIELISHVIIDQDNIPTAGITVTQKDDGSTFAYDGLLIWSDARSGGSYTTFNYNGYTNYPVQFSHGSRNLLNTYITDGTTMSIITDKIRNVIKQSYADTGNLFYPDAVFQRVPEKFTSFKIGADGIASVTFYKAWGLTRK